MATAANPSDTDQPSSAATPADDSKAVANGFSKRITSFMASRHFGLWSSLIAVIMCSILLGLGTWQVIRLHQKNTLIDHMTAQINQPERDLRLRPPADNAAWNALDYRRVVLQGDWFDLQQFKLIPRTYEGQSGYHLLVPFRLQNGQMILVNRGWAPDKSDMGPQSQNGTAVIAGIIRTAPTEKPFGMMDNNPAKSQWAWPDIKAMANVIGVHELAPVILYAERAGETPDKNVNDADEFPIGGQAQLAVRNEHRNYALTWYLMGLSFLVIWLAAAKSKAKPVVAATDAPPADND